MRQSKNWLPTYCDEACVIIELKGVWTPTKKGKRFCQRHGGMVNTCSHCGKDFHSLRGHTATCGNACRMAKSRANRLQCESVTRGVAAK